MSGKVSHEAACAAAEWWASKIDGRHHHDNGDRSPGGLLAMILADTGMQPPSEEQLDLFKAALIKRLESGQYTFNGRTSLYCDYGPDLVLRESASEAGITKNNFPYKTGMMIQNDVVSVKDGYYSQYCTIYPKTTKEEKTW